MARAKRAKVDWQAVEILYLTAPDEPGLRTLAARLGVSESALMSRAHRGKWSAKRAAAKAIAPRAPDSPDAHAPMMAGDSDKPGESGEKETDTDTDTEKCDKLSHAGALSSDELSLTAARVKALRAEGYEKTMAGQATRIAQVISKLSDVELLANADRIAKLDTVARRNLGIDATENGQRAPLVQIALLGSIDKTSLPKVVSASPSEA